MPKTKKRTTARATPPPNELTVGAITVRVERWGVIPTVLNPAIRSAMKQPEVRALLKGTQHRVLGVEFIEPDKKAATPKETTRYCATVYDYTNQRSLLIEGDLNRPGKLNVSESAEQPLPSPEEFDAAAARLSTQRGIDTAGVRLYRPMPPLTEQTLPDGSVRRSLNVGILPLEGDGESDAPFTRTLSAPAQAHEIVSVDMSDARRARSLSLAEGAPERTLARHDICGFPDANQPTTRRGTPGNVRVTVTKNGQVIWRFFVTRPSASSGRRGSGVELRFVDYKGKRVLYRAHVPILNVQYDRDACGPYRDWQWQEGMFTADGRDAAPGFRLCPQPAHSLLTSGTDRGNFRGVAIYIEGEEVVLLSEMEAGWYRYISLWRLHSDGTIRPRFGFTGVDDSCICEVHHHHCYWRFDFDVRRNVNNRVLEHNDPPLPDTPNGANWHAFKFETRRVRDAARKRKWRVASTISPEAYDIVPGAEDGQADAFGIADLWVLRERVTELEDGRIRTQGPASTVMANIDRFLNGESVDDKDVVVWYAAHFSHDVHAPDDDGHQHGHVMGPDLVPVNW